MPPPTGIGPNSAILEGNTAMTTALSSTRTQLLCCIASGLALADFASAQLTVTAQADTGWTASAFANGAQTQIVPPGTPVTTSRSISATESDTIFLAPGVPCGGVSATANATATIGPPGGALFARLSTVSTASASGCSASANSSFTGSIEAVFTSPVPVEGEFTVEFTNNFGLLLSSGADLDVIDLETGESYGPRLSTMFDSLTDTTRYSFRGEVAPTGRRFRLVASSSCFASPFPGPSSCNSEGSAEVRFQPLGPGVRVRSEGTPCTASAPSLDVTLERFFESSPSNPSGPLVFREARYEASGIRPQTTGHFLVLGFTDPLATIPPTNCPLLTDILAPFLLTPDAAGRAVFSLALEPGLPVAELRAQFLAVEVVAGTAMWETSEALIVSTQ